jgi:hypothetical protein
VAWRVSAEKSGAPALNIEADSLDEALAGIAASAGMQLESTNADPP